MSNCKTMQIFLKLDYICVFHSLISFFLLYQSQVFHLFINYLIFIKKVIISLFTFAFYKYLRKEEERVFGSISSGGGIKKDMYFIKVM